MHGARLLLHLVCLVYILIIFEWIYSASSPMHFFRVPYNNFLVAYMAICTYIQFDVGSSLAMI